jgi:hypothetical protein
MPNPPEISILSLSGTTATLALAQDPAAVSTTIYLLDPATGTVLETFPGEMPPTAVLAGLDPNQAYEVVAVSTDGVDMSPPSLTRHIRPGTWEGDLKNLVVAEPRPNTRYYELYDRLGGLLDGPTPYHWLLDTRAFATEQDAQNVEYEVKAFDQNGDQVFIPNKRFRTNRALCLITGSMNRIHGAPGWPHQVIARPKGYRVQPTPQRSLQVSGDVVAYPNYLGEWGMYLVSGTVIEINFFDKLFEFVVPFTAQAALLDLPLVERSLAVKNT